MKNYKRIHSTCPPTCLHIVLRWLGVRIRFWIWGCCLWNRSWCYMPCRRCSSRFQPSSRIYSMHLSSRLSHHLGAMSPFAFSPHRTTLYYVSSCPSFRANTIVHANRSKRENKMRLKSENGNCDRLVLE